MTRREMRVAVVTGARRGIGRGIAFALADNGWKIIVVDVEDDAVTAETMVGLRHRGVEATFVKGDIAEVENAGRICEASFEAFGRVHALVNNAGIQVKDRGTGILATTVESFDRLINVNLRGTFFLTQAFANALLKQRQTDQSFTSIITVSSSNALHAKTKGAEYCISKTGLSMMNKIMALQLAPHGIACYEVQPGLIKTEMNASMHDVYEPVVSAGLTPIPRWGHADDVGHTVATLANGGLPFATGETLHVDGGLHIRRSPFESPFVRSLRKPPVNPS